MLLPFSFEGVLLANGIEPAPDEEYVVDNGLRTATGFYQSDDLGSNMENTVFLKLRQTRQ